MSALVLEHLGDLVLVGVGADQYPSLDAVAFDGVDLPAAGGPRLGPAQGFDLSVLADDLAVPVDDENGVIHLIGGRVPLRVRQKNRQAVLLHQPKEPFHPWVGLGQYPIGADRLHEQVAGDAQLGGYHPLGALLGGDLDAPLHQLAVVVDVAGDRGQM